MDFKWWVSLAVTLSPHLVDVAICTFPMMVWILWNHVPPGVRLSKYLRTISSDSANAPSKAARVRGRLTTKQKLCGTFDIYTVLRSSVFENVNRKSAREEVGANNCWSDFSSWRRQSPNPKGLLGCNPEKLEIFCKGKLPLSRHVVRALDFSLEKELKVRTRVKNIDHTLRLFKEMYNFFAFYPTALGKRHVNRIQEDGSPSPL